MINNIINGITVRLGEVFPADWRVYTENVEQGLKPPCFFVREINTSATLQLGSRQKRTNLFDIHFFPSGGRKQMREVQQAFYDHFDPLPLPDGTMVHAMNMRAEIEDDVLHLFVNYNIITQHTRTPDPYMEEIGIAGEVKI